MLDIKYEIKFKVGKKNVILYNPYLTNELEVGFKWCNLFPNQTFKQILFQPEKNIIKFIDKEKFGVKIKKDENLEAIKDAIKIRNMVINDLAQYNRRLANGQEDIIAIFDSCNKEYFFTTETSLENGELSVKYNNAIIYYLNQEAKIKGKEIKFEDFADMQMQMNNAMKNFDLSKFQLKDLNENEKYYSISFETMAKFLCYKK